MNKSIAAELPAILANVKSISNENGEEILDIYVYKNHILQKKIKKPYYELQELEDFMKIKYQKRFVEKGIMRMEPLSFSIG